jgi:hypothetical protein
LEPVGEKLEDLRWGCVGCYVKVLCRSSQQQISDTASDKIRPETCRA